MRFCDGNDLKVRSLMDSQWSDLARISNVCALQQEFGGSTFFADTLMAPSRGVEFSFSAYHEAASVES
jgi:hypothetical protein